MAEQRVLHPGRRFQIDALKSTPPGRQIAPLLKRAELPRDGLPAKPLALGIDYEQGVRAPRGRAPASTAPYRKLDDPRGRPLPRSPPARFAGPARPPDAADATSRSRIPRASATAASNRARSCSGVSVSSQRALTAPMTPLTVDGCTPSMSVRYSSLTQRASARTADPVCAPQGAVRLRPGYGRARPAHLRGDPLLPMPDRDQLAGLPQIALHQLPRAIDRPLKRPRPKEPRADLTDKVIEDRLAAPIPKVGGHLAQPLRLDPWVCGELLADPVSKRIQLRPRRRPRVLRRLCGR